MTKRVEEIRERARELLKQVYEAMLVKDVDDLGRRRTTVNEERGIDVLEAALAQAEREREGETLRANKYLDKLKEARAEVERLKEQTTYPDDPARSVAAMFSRMSPEDKRAFNFCVKAAAREAEADLARTRAALEKYVQAGETWGETHLCVAKVGSPESDASASADLALMEARDEARAALEGRG